MNSQEIKKYTIEVLKQGFPNKKTLDKLSTSDNGNLLFDGKEIKGNGGSGSLSDLNIEEIFKANSANEMVSEGETITLPKNYNEYDQIVLGMGTKGDGLDYGLDYFYLYPKASNKIHFAGYYQRWGSVTFENNICTLNYGRQAGEDSNRAFCIASLYGINFGNGQTFAVDDKLDLESENPVQNKVIAASLNGIDTLLDYILGNEIETSNVYKIFDGVGIGEGGALE